MRKRVALLISCLFLLTIAASAQTMQADKSKRPSPPANTQCRFANGKTITVDYSSPRIKGRKIFGGLVPYGQVWRAGANEATTFVTDSDVRVGDKDVPAGSYTLFAIPNQNQWTLIISKKTGEWGIPYAGESNDFARTNMQATSISSPVENFTISFDQNGASCSLHMDWENTRASVDITEKK